MVEVRGFTKTRRGQTWSRLLALDRNVWLILIESLSPYLPR
jgi:hypothetical protein